MNSRMSLQKGIKRISEVQLTEKLLLKYWFKESGFKTTQENVFNFCAQPDLNKKTKPWGPTPDVWIIFKAFTHHNRSQVMDSFQTDLNVELVDPVCIKL